MDEILVLALVGCLLAVGSSGQSMTDTHSLLDSLLTNYDKRVRPATDQSAPVYVNVTYDLVAVKGFDEVAEKLSTVAVFYVTWRDPRVTWNPMLYNQTYSILVNSESVWVPELVLVNPTDIVEVLGDKWMKVRYTFDGVAFWNPGGVFDTSCTSDVTYYPFDCQVCDLMFIPWGYSAAEIYLLSTDQQALQTYFYENGEWQLKSTSAVAYVNEAGFFSTFLVTLRIERRPTFFLVNVVLPIIFMGLLNILVFVLPAESGERLSYAITVLLAIAVFLTLVGDNMPKTSQPMSSLCYFLIINLALSSVICIGVIFNMTLFFKDDSIPIPPWVVWLAKVVSCRRSKVTMVEDFRPEGADDTEKKETPPIKLANAFCDDNGARLITWKDVSRMSDKLMCVGSLLWILVSGTSFMVMVATHNVPGVQPKS